MNRWERKSIHIWRGGTLGEWMGLYLPDPDKILLIQGFLTCRWVDWDNWGSLKPIGSLDNVLQAWWMRGKDGTEENRRRTGEAGV